MTLAQKCLELADAAIRDRRAVYGSPDANYHRLSGLWSAVLETDVSALETVLCCIQMKVARLVNDPLHADSWIDVAGYAAIGFEISQLLKEREDG
jgi:hypothetical protein